MVGNAFFYNSHIKKSIYNQTYATPFCKTKTLLRNKDVIACTILCDKNQLRKTKRMR